MPGDRDRGRDGARLAELTDRLEPLLVYAWRRHLSATVSRMMADADPESFGLTKMRSVGFADLVNFTALVRRLSERDLARLVSRFEALSADVITAHGGASSRRSATRCSSRPSAPRRQPPSRSTSSTR